MRQFILAALLALILFSPAYAQTAEERQRLEWAGQRGRLLFEIDRAAWVTTDDLREHLPRDAQRAVRGWTVEPDGAGYVVVYFMPGEGELGWRFIAPASRTGAWSPARLSARMRGRSLPRCSAESPPRAVSLSK